VPDGDGNVRAFFTRDGSFTRGANNSLVTSDGYTVLGENGPIVLQEGPFTVTDDGTILQEGEVIDRLLITEFEDTAALRKFGYNLCRQTEMRQCADFQALYSRATRSFQMSMSYVKWST
jgi:flagellar basal-body rod protein FlgG